MKKKSIIGLVTAIISVSTLAGCGETKYSTNVEYNGNKEYGYALGSGSIAKGKDFKIQLYPNMGCDVASIGFKAKTADGYADAKDIIHGENDETITKNSEAKTITVKGEGVEGKYTVNFTCGSKAEGEDRVYTQIYTLFKQDGNYLEINPQTNNTIVLDTPTENLTTERSYPYNLGETITLPTFINGYDYEIKSWKYTDGSGTVKTINAGEKLTLVDLVAPKKDENATGVHKDDMKLVLEVNEVISEPTDILYTAIQNLKAIDRKVLTTTSSLEDENDAETLIINGYDYKYEYKDKSANETKEIIINTNNLYEKQSDSLYYVLRGFDNGDVELSALEGGIRSIPNMKKYLDLLLTDVGTDGVDSFNEYYKIMSDETLELASSKYKLRIDSNKETIDSKNCFALVLYDDTTEEKDAVYTMYIYQGDILKIKSADGFEFSIKETKDTFQIPEDGKSGITVYDMYTVKLKAKTSNDEDYIADNSALKNYFDTLNTNYDNIIKIVDYLRTGTYKDELYNLINTDSKYADLKNLLKQYNYILEIENEEVNEESIGLDKFKNISYDESGIIELVVDDTHSLYQGSAMATKISNYITTNNKILAEMESLLGQATGEFTYALNSENTEISSITQTKSGDNTCSDAITNENHPVYALINKLLELKDGTYNYKKYEYKNNNYYFYYNSEDVADVIIKTDGNNNISGIDLVNIESNNRYTYSFTFSHE